MFNANRIKKILCTNVQTINLQHTQQQQQKKAFPGTSSTVRDMHTERNIESWITAGNLKQLDHLVS